MSLIVFDTQYKLICDILGTSKIAKEKYDIVVKCMQTVRQSISKDLIQLDLISKSKSNSSQSVNNVSSQSDNDFTINDSQSQDIEENPIIDINTNSEQKSKFVKLSSEEKLDFMFNKILEMDSKLNNKVNGQTSRRTPNQIYIKHNNRNQWQYERNGRNKKFVNKKNTSQNSQIFHRNFGQNFQNNYIPYNNSFNSQPMYAIQPFPYNHYNPSQQYIQQYSPNVSSAQNNLSQQNSRHFLGQPLPQMPRLY